MEENTSKNDKCFDGRVHNILRKHAIREMKAAQSDNSPSTSSQRSWRERDSGDRRSNNTGKHRRYAHPRPPPGLRGKEIGLYYRDRARKEKENENQKIEASVELPPAILEKVERTLSAIDQAANSDCRSGFEDYFQSIKESNFQQFLTDKKSDMIEVDRNIDKNLQETYGEMLSRRNYTWNLTARDRLPARSKKGDILGAIAASQVVLISGDTGCGKTTQVPQYILDQYLSSSNGSRCKIFCTQPRRISAITVAERVAWERCEAIGNTVGYQIRLQSVVPRDRGSITFCTTGILLKRLASDPLLNDISHIILDEVHERDVNTDIILGILQEIKSHRPELRIVLMSATFSVDTFCKYFDSCTSIEIPGTLFPVKELYLEDVLEETKFVHFPDTPAKKPQKWEKFRNKHKHYDESDDFQSFIRPYARSIVDRYPKFVIEGIQNPNSEQFNSDLVCALIFHIAFYQPDGAILVFLPGYEKISTVHKALMNSKKYSAQKFLLFGLHSMMPTADQKTVFEKPPNGIRKVILSTSIAETSITIEDIVYVIDTGKGKVSEYNIDTKLKTLKETWTTLANAKQRKGRAGRVQAGVCYRLYTRAREYTFEMFPTPEILRIRLESVILSLKVLRIHDVGDFFSRLISAPSEILVKNSIDFLKSLNALDEQEFLTPLGLHLARLPVEPQIGKMILLAALFKCLDPITSVAASLSFKDPFYRPLGKEKLVDEVRLRLSNDTKSDHLMLANVIAEYRKEKQRGNGKSFCYENFLSGGILNQLENMKNQFCEILMDARFIKHPNPLNEENNFHSNNVYLLRSIISAALYPNIAKVRKIKMVKNMANPVISVITPEDGRVCFHPSSINSRQWTLEEKFFVYFTKHKSTSVFLFDTTMVSPLSLLLFGDGELQDLGDDGSCFMSLNGVFRFKANLSSANLILKLRKLLDNLLGKKAMNPSTIDASPEDISLINSVVEVLNAKCNGASDNVSSDDD